MILLLFLDSRRIAQNIDKQEITTHLIYVAYLKKNALL